MPDLPKYRLVLVDNSDFECTTESQAEDYGLEVVYNQEREVMVVGPRGTDEDLLAQRLADLVDRWDVAPDVDFPHKTNFGEFVVHHNLDPSAEVQKQLQELAMSVKYGFAELALFERDEGADTYSFTDCSSGAQVNDPSLVDWRRVAFSDFPQCTPANTQFDLIGDRGHWDVPAQIQSTETWVLPDMYDYWRTKARAQSLRELGELLGEKPFTRSGQHPETVEALTLDYRLMLVEFDPYGYVSEVRLPISPDDFEMSWEPVISAELMQNAHGRWELLLGEPVVPGEEAPLVPDDHLHIQVEDPSVVSHLFGPMLAEYQHRLGKYQAIWTGEPNLSFGAPAALQQPGPGL